MKQLIVRVPEELLIAIKMKSLEKKVTVKEAVTSLLEAWVNGQLEVKNVVKKEEPKPKAESQPKPSESQNWMAEDKVEVEKESEPEDLGSIMDRMFDEQAKPSSSKRNTFY